MFVKKMLAIILIFVCSIGMGGCSLIDKGIEHNVINNENVEFVTKQLTVIIMSEIEAKPNDIENIRNILVKLKSLLVENNSSISFVKDIFSGSDAQLDTTIQFWENGQLISINMPAKYKLYVLSLLDILERYVQQNVKLNIEFEHKDLVISALDGATEGLDEFEKITN